MRFFQLFIVLTCLTLLAGCKSKVIDASSYEKMSSSFSEVLSSLPADEKKQFLQAYSTIVFSYQNHVAFKEKGDTRAVIQNRLDNKISGMDSSQILEEYRKVQKIKAQWDIQRIKKEINHAKDNKNQLKQVTIDQYKLYMEKDGQLDRMFMEIVIHNGSKFELTSVNFLIRLGSSYSDNISSQKRNILVRFPSGLEQDKTVLKKIDLGRPSSSRYLYKNPTLAEYSTSRISGNNVDITANIYPTLPILEKRLKQKQDAFDKEFTVK